MPGRWSIAGTSVPHLDPHTARALGIAAIYQQPSLFPHLTVAENIALALEERRAVAAAFAGRRGGGAPRSCWRASGLRSIRTGCVESLSMPEQQVVEIAKAIGADARILIMDEPTASLSDARGRAVCSPSSRGCAQHGVGIVYISHRLEEIAADRRSRSPCCVTDERSRRAPTGDVDRAELIRLMVGRELAAVFPKRTVAIGEVALETRRLTAAAGGIHDVSLVVRRGRDSRDCRARRLGADRARPRRCSASRRPIRARF